MADIAENPAAQRLIEGLSGVGARFSDPSAVTDAELQRETISFLQKLNSIMAEEGQTPTPITTVDAATLQNLRTQIERNFNRADDNGVTGLEKLRALVDGDVDTLLAGADIASRVLGASELNSIYRSGSKAENARDALIFAASHDEDTMRLLQTLRRDAPGILNNLPAAVALLEGSDDMLADLQTLADAGLYDTTPTMPGVGAPADPAQEYTAAISALEAAAGSTNTDGAWDSTDRQAMQTMSRVSISSRF